MIIDGAGHFPWVERPDETRAALRYALPRGKRVVIDSAGHFPWVERPDETRAALRSFLVAV